MLDMRLEREIEGCSACSFLLKKLKNEARNASYDQIKQEMKIKSERTDLGI